MDITVLALTFAAIFVVELPDKTFLATLVLATRYRPLFVWIGVGAAFLVQCLVAVVFGHVISLLPADLVRSLAAGMFAIGAIVLFRSARLADRADAGATGDSEAAGVAPTALRVIGTSFLVLFTAEWGDLSQILTVTLAARYEQPVSVFAGAWLALLTVSGLATVVGQTLLRRVRLSSLQYVGAAVCLLLAALTAYELVRR